VPVIGVSVETGKGLDELEAALTAHAGWVASHRTPAETARRRATYRVQDLVLRRLEDQLATLSPDDYDLPLPELYQRVLTGLAQI